MECSNQGDGGLHGRAAYCANCFEAVQYRLDVLREQVGSCYECGFIAWRPVEDRHVCAVCEMRAQLCEMRRQLAMHHVM